MEVSVWEFWQAVYMNCDTFVLRSLYRWASQDCCICGLNQNSLLYNLSMCKGSVGKYTLLVVQDNSTEDYRGSRSNHLTHTVDGLWNKNPPVLKKISRVRMK